MFFDEFGAIHKSRCDPLPTCAQRDQYLRPGKEDGISPPSLFNTLKGTREDPKAKEILAGTLGLHQDELFFRQEAG